MTHLLIILFYLEALFGVSLLGYGVIHSSFFLMAVGVGIMSFHILEDQILRKIIAHHNKPSTE